MTAMEITQLKENLLELLENLDRKNLDFLKTQEEVTQQKGDEIDLVESESQSKLLLRFNGRSNKYIKKLRSTLDRIDAGEFGICADCGAPIENKRLQARPTATLCIHCKEEQENVERNIFSEKKKTSAIWDCNQL